MTNFTFLFVAALVLNASVTFRSSEYYANKYGSKKDNGKSTESSSSSSKDSSSAEDTAEKREWHKLLKRYLVVYLLATLSDWLQGPYVYALYADYGFSQHEIAVLFVAGFGSSMVFGSFVGSIADWGGRRAFVVLFSVVYALSCLTKRTCVLCACIQNIYLRFVLFEKESYSHISFPSFRTTSPTTSTTDFKDFKVLLLGRLLGGIATSLLFSVFEAWLIRAHADRKLKKYLPKSFGWAAYCNSVIAILAGLLANKAANVMKMKPFFGSAGSASAASSSKVLYIGGYLSPFDFALLALVACGFFAATTWEENYGESGSAAAAAADKDSNDGDTVSSNVSTGNDSAGSGAMSGSDGKWYGGLKSAFTTTIRNTDILLCGAISSMFEGSMYIFVFMWTPALSENYQGGELPFGLIFSTFMVCCMAGSSIFTCLLDKYTGEQMAVGVFAVASLAMALVAAASNHTIKFLGMNLFEICVGMYFPISKYYILFERNELNQGDTS